MSGTAIAEALGAWLPRQRWFAGKARTVTSVTVADTALLDDSLLVVIAKVGYADGGVERYHAPLATGGRGEVVARFRGRAWVDAAGDPAACRRLAALSLDPAAVPTEGGGSLRGHPVDARGGSGEDPRPTQDQSRGQPRPLGAEQSNTSVVFGDSSILKLFRRLEPGLNPDVELTRGLTEAGFPHTPPQYGALELDDGTEPTALAVLSAFVAGGREGWHLALEEVAALTSGDTATLPLLARIDDLGRAVARAHAALAHRFGSRRAGREDVTAWVASMATQARAVLRTAAERAPEQAAPALARDDELFARLGALEHVEDPGPLVRVHGDLHLGQVLLDRDAVWQLLDWEGEPARPLTERRAPHTPLRDVAGMLRSLDYAASHADPTTPPPAAVARWRDDARERFLAGYREVAAAEGLLPADPAAEAALLAAFELDKAVYELGYELASRPAWVPIPVAGIVRVLDRAPEGKPGLDRSTGGLGVAGTRTDWRAPTGEVRALLDGAHRDPHRVLGVHEVGSGAAVRVYRPDAERVEVLVEGRAQGGGGTSVEAERTDERGFFEARLGERPKPTEYRLRVTYPDGATFDLRDPYAFWPSLGEIDVYLAGEGRHEELWRRMGAHVVEREGVSGTTFAVWAPNARSVRAVGDFNSWDGRLHPMRMLGGSGIWELFLPEVGPGARYKYEIVTGEGAAVTRADPYAFATERPPGTSSRIHESAYEWADDRWLAERREGSALREPMSIYEVHLGSWRHRGGGGDPDDGTPLGYRELAHELADHATAMGFTHVELLPVAEHPFGGSWGYQVTGYYAPTSRYGDPDDFRYFVDHLHHRGIGVLVDWVPAHFPRDEWALARFDGSALYEHADPRQGEHPDWGTLVFNYGRNEVRNFLIANALYWIEELHVDGLRVDAVASMLYLDYSRKAGEWVPNRYGGRENLEAVEFLKELNAVVHGRNPGVLMIAEESTSWPGVSRPVHLGGLGFGFKWNMGWMHDTLSYLTHDPIHRRFHHHELTFALMYAWSENFILPLSHDEVVHGKRNLIDKMPGDRWQKFANLRCLYAYMWAHPGKQLLFMGGEFGQWREWSEQRSLDWHLLDEDDHAGLQRLVADLNTVYRASPALWQRDDDPDGFAWIDANDADNNVVSFIRYGDEGPPLVCVANLSARHRDATRVGLPVAGRWRELVNTDAARYGGANVGNLGSVKATDQPWHGLPASASMTLPPLGVLWLAPDA